MMADVENVGLALKSLFNVILAESEVNPPFAAKLAQALRAVEQDAAAPEAAETAQSSEDEAAAQEAGSFDPLQVHLEAAVIDGLEVQVREFLGKLTRPQLKEIVSAQRLPHATGLMSLIDTAETSSEAIDSIIDSVVEKVRARISAAS
jgi:hypothetical protein